MSYQIHATLGQGADLMADVMVQATYRFELLVAIQCLTVPVGFLIGIVLAGLLVGY